MKAMILKFLLGRGLSKGSEVISKLVRHGMGWFGGVLAGYNVATTDQLLTVENGALALGAIAWSLARAFLEPKLKEWL